MMVNFSDAPRSPNISPAWLISVPRPRTSLTAPRATRARQNPRPVASPSATEGRGALREAKASALPIMAQVQPGLHQKLDHSDHRSNNQDVSRNPDFRSQKTTGQRNRKVGKNQGQYRGQAQSEAVDDGVGDCQQRAEAEQHDETGVLLPEAIRKNLPVVSLHVASL